MELRMGSLPTLAERAGGAVVSRCAHEAVRAPMLMALRADRNGKDEATMPRTRLAAAKGQRPARPPSWIVGGRSQPAAMTG
jgi:hypothetical protein